MKLTAISVARVKAPLVKVYWLLSSQFGLDPLRFIRAVRGLPAFFRDLLLFRQHYKGKLTLLPCFHDRFEEGGTTKSEYFWQDLLVARWIHQAAPRTHVDIGSRVDGFVAHLASFRELEVFDVRPITTNIPGITFRQANLMNPGSLGDSCYNGYCDSLSCLHAIEHFGLGRYGDPINPLGYRLGLQNMAKLVRSGGVFYLSTPVGRERIEFNANWVFDPRTIVDALRSSGMALKALTVISHADGVRDVEPSDVALAELSQQHYNLALFTFHKTDGTQCRDL